MKVLPEPEPWHESMSRTPVRDRRLPSRPRVLQFTCPQEPRVGPALEPSHMVVIPARTGDTNHYRPGNGCRESNERPVGLGLVPAKGTAGRPQPGRAIAMKTGAPINLYGPPKTRGLQFFNVWDF